MITQSKPASASKGNGQTSSGERFDIGVAIRQYADAAEEYAKANDRFTSVCDQLRGLLGSNRTVVAQIDMRAYLVRTDRVGNLDVQVIESV